MTLKSGSCAKRNRIRLTDTDYHDALQRDQLKPVGSVRVMVEDAKLLITDDGIYRETKRPVRIGGFIVLGALALHPAEVVPLALMTY